MGSLMALRLRVTEDFHEINSLPINGRFSSGDAKSFVRSNALIELPTYLI